jgi:hypothetical protein
MDPHKFQIEQDQLNKTGFQFKICTPICKPNFSFVVANYLVSHAQNSECNSECTTDEVHKGTAGCQGNPGPGFVYTAQFHEMGGMAVSTVAAWEPQLDQAPTTAWKIAPICPTGKYPNHDFLVKGQTFDATNATHCKACCPADHIMNYPGKPGKVFDCSAYDSDAPSKLKIITGLKEPICVKPCDFQSIRIPGADATAVPICIKVCQDHEILNRERDPNDPKSPRCYQVCPPGKRIAF